MQPTRTEGPDYYHKVVDCQWACPAHTPVPEYIRLIADGRYDDAYMINWKSNECFPILNPISIAVYKLTATLFILTPYSYNRFTRRSPYRSLPALLL